MTQLFRMPCANGEGLLLKRYKDMFFPNVDIADPEKALKLHQEFLYKDADILLCSCPKSGNHWMRNLLWKLKSRDHSERPCDAFIELSPQEDIVNQSEPRIFGTHLRPGQFCPSRIENKGRIVLVLRNPKDVAVSFYHHIKNARPIKNPQTWDEFIQSFVKGEIQMGSLFTYLRQWELLLKNISEGKSCLKVGVFYFEDMVLNPKESIARLNEFLEFGRDEKYLQKVQSQTTFGALKELYTDNSSLRHPLCIDDDGNSLIFRKGQVGDWKNHFTVAQSETFDTLMQEALTGIIRFKYEI